jgi:hypothetical protein
MRHLRAPLRLLLLAATLTACGRHRDDAAPREETPISAQRRTASMPADSLHEGDVRIVTEDNGIDLALIGDTISSGLSQAALAKVRSETDTSRVSGSGFGASIEKMVKGTVSSAIATRVSFPLSAVKDVRYEAGALRFDWVGEPPKVFSSTKVNGKPILESFRADEAQRFVDAVRARKRNQTQM